ncbi:hypothetical protein ARMSODRAFT_1089269 [Armillaria solidipes]|uniref:Uncharacterized protein n=1 Tax=Armillaria solidipes TaxID=1076256 RepID=A0A2H3AZK3_9AGAR|nr:hypothetical protein ARMSODRAFT_1089269 [Armillaria solidipes]
MSKSPTKSQSKAKPPPRPESLVHMEQRLKKTIPSWLWDACIPIAEDDNTDSDCIYSTTTSSENKRMAMKRMQDLVNEGFHQKYPDRPEEKDIKVYSEPTSESMKVLKELLDTSPVAKGRLDDFTDAERQYVYFHQDMFSGSQSWGWTSDYEQKIKDTLDVVKEEHGEKELTVARWAVRDRCAECISGITVYDGVHSYQWSDESIKWLRDNPPIERNPGRKLVKLQ